MNQPPTHIIKYSCIAFCALMAFLVCSYISLYHYKMPVYEHLFLTSFFDRSILAGEIGLFELGYTNIKGGHWYLTGNWLGLILAKLTHWNIFWDSVCVMLLLGVTFMNMVRLVYLLEVDKSRKYLMAAACAFFVFSLDQSRNLLWQHQISHFICLAAMTGALLLFSRPNLNIRHHVMLMLLAAVATYSTAAGLIFTLILVGFMWLRRQPFLVSIIWSLFLALLLWHYIDAVFSNAAQSHHWDYMPSSESYAPALALNIIRYVIHSLGTAVAGGIKDFTTLYVVAFCFGTIGLLLYIYVSIRLAVELLHAKGHISPIHCVWILQSSVIGYFLAASIGRHNAAHFGFIDTGITLGNIFWLTMVIELLYIIKPMREHICMAVCCFALLFIGTKSYSAYQLSVYQANTSLKFDRIASDIKTHWPDINEPMIKLMVWEESVEDLKVRFEVMRQHQYNLFKNSEQ